MAHVPVVFALAKKKCTFCKIFTFLIYKTVHICVKVLHKTATNSNDYIISRKKEKIQENRKIEEKKKKRIFYKIFTYLKHKNAKMYVNLV